MKLHLKYLVPSVFEVVGAGFVTVVLVLVANSHQLLNYYGLQSSDQVLRTSATGAVSSALDKLDGLTATASVVTFVIWAVVGMVCFSIVQSIGQTISELEFEEQLSSRRYIHPATFTKAHFWKGVVQDFVGLAASFALLAAAVSAFVLFVLPVGLAYSRLFLFTINLVNAGYFVIGLAVMFVGLLAVDICIRLLLQRRRITAPIKD